MTVKMEKVIFNYLLNKKIPLIVNNVFLKGKDIRGVKVPYEADIVYMTNSRYLYEIEIKVSRPDLLADFKKKHTHNDERLKAVYYAISSNVKFSENEIPENFGILIVENEKVTTLRKPKLKKVNELSHEEAWGFYRLGALRNMYRTAKGDFRRISELK